MSSVSQMNVNPADAEERARVNKALFGDLPQAQQYATYRPDYPESLYEVIMQYMDKKRKQDHAQGKGRVMYEQAVDVACGTGQATVDLTRYFNRVHGIDISQQQLQNATQHEKITYAVGSDEDLGVIPDGSTDLVTVAQGAHWLNFPSFFREIDRILNPHTGCVAFWVYGNSELQSAQMQAVFDRFYWDVLKAAGYWDLRREHVEARYRDMKMLYADTERVDEGIVIEKRMNAEEFVGYLTSWSGYNSMAKDKPDEAQSELALVEQKFNEECQKDPSLVDSQGRFLVSWPVSVLLAHKSAIVQP
eukprot:Nk52_evm31s151 gene=Nk52_evmTU31s151